MTEPHAIPGMWRSASRRTPRQPLGQQQHFRQRELRPSLGLLGMEAARDRLDGLAGAGDERIELGEAERRASRPRWPAPRPGLPLARRSSRAMARRVAQMSPSAGLLSRWPAAAPASKRPCQEARTAAAIAHAPYVPALPQPYDAEHEQRQPRKRDRQDEQRLRPIASQHVAKSHARCSGCAVCFFAWRSPAASPSAKARRTSSVGAVMPRR